VRLVPDYVWAVITIWHEAQDQSFAGKVAVGEVIRNRTKAKYRSDGTLAGTVLWPVQFSGWNAHDASPNYRERIEGAKLDADNPIVKECIRAWAEVEAGSNTVKGAMDYFNPKICNPAWAVGATILAEIDDHRFVALKGAK
jgi:spore germination cell wall hydrolase CwlJ-like protein